MRILFLDLASHNGTLACVEAKAVVAIDQIDHRIGDEALIPRFHAVLDKAGWKDRDLTGIACVVGPGGFTSLRVAVAMANALAHTLEIPVAGIHLSEIYLARVRKSEDRSSKSEGNSQFEMQNSKLPSDFGFRISDFNGVWLHSTKSTHLFIRGFGMAATQWPAARLIAAEECVSSIAHAIPIPQYVGELLGTHRALMEAKNIEPSPLRSLEEILPDFLATLDYKKTPLQPWYGREG